MNGTPEIPDLRSMVLPTKPDCPIKYTFTTLGTPDESPSQAILIVFVNGLGLPQSSWQPTLQLLRTDLAASQAFPSDAGGKSYAVTAVTYDRYGQGLSQPLPTGAAEPEPHDMRDAVADLSAFIDGVQSQHLGPFVFRRKPVRLLLVAHSVGVPLARLFAEHRPVAALLALDSNMANNDFVSLFPDPDAAGFDPARDLPVDATLEQLRSARAFARAMFHPAAPNAENLDRSTLPTLLPRSDRPVLSGDGNSSCGTSGGLLLRVAGHDPQTFAEESLKVWPRGLTEWYVQPVWEKYNEGLLAIAGDEPASRGEVVIAPNSGHFIQKNNPRFVADEVVGLLRRLCGGEL